jgi:hypothetical protein
MTNFLLNRGGAGKSMTRHETGERLSGLIQQLIQVVAGYDRLAGLFEESQRQRIEERQRHSRSEIAKISELILSTGAVPPRELSGDAVLPSADSAVEALEALMEVERTFAGAVKDERKLPHQLRTRALLEELSSNTEKRIDMLHRISTDLGVMVP